MLKKIKLGILGIVIVISAVFACVPAQADDAANLLTEKRAIVKQIIKLSGELATLRMRLNEVSNLWTVSGFGSGGGKEISAADLNTMTLNILVTPNQLALVITAINNLEKLLNNEIPTQNPWGEYISAVREKSF